MADTISLADTNLFNVTRFSGDAGSVVMAGDRVSIRNSQISTAALGNGASDTGNVALSGNDISVASSLISTEAQGNGTAHDVSLIANSISLADTRIYSLAYDGGTGNVVLSGNDISIVSSQIMTETRGNGDARDIQISARDRITVTGSGKIQTVASQISSGSAGGITLSSPTITLSGAGVVSSSTFGWSTSSPTPGIVLNASGSLSLSDGFTVVSLTQGLQTGADIIVNAGNVALSRGAELWSQSDGSAGSGGITVAAAGTVVIDGSSASRASGIHSHARGSGNSGAITVNAANVALSNGGSIAGDSLGIGEAASIFVHASQDVSISGMDINRSLPSGIFAESLGNGDAGTIAVEARSVWLFQGGTIATRSIGTGDAGNIDITASIFVLLNNGSITSYAVGGSDHAGAITVNNPQFFIMANSTVNSSSYLGAGGDVYVGTNYFFSSQSLFDLDGGTTNGQLIITGPQVDLSGQLAKLDMRFIDVLNLLPEICDKRLGEVTGTLTWTGRGSMPFEASQPQFASAFDVLMRQETAKRGYRRADAALPPGPQLGGSRGKAPAGCQDSDWGVRLAD